MDKQRNSKIHINHSLDCYSDINNDGNVNAFLYPAAFLQKNSPNIQCASQAVTNIARVNQCPE